MEYRTQFSKCNPWKFVPAFFEQKASAGIFERPEFLPAANGLINSSETSYFQFKLDANKDSISTISFSIKSFGCNGDELDSLSDSFVGGGSYAGTSDNSSFIVNEVFYSADSGFSIFEVSVFTSFYGAEEAVQFQLEIDYGIGEEPEVLLSEFQKIVGDRTIFQRFPGVIKLEYRDSQNRFLNGIKTSDSHYNILYWGNSHFQENDFDSEEEISTSLRAEDQLIQSSSILETTFAILNAPFYILELFAKALDFDDVKINGQAFTRVGEPDIIHQYDKSTNRVSFSITVKRAVNDDFYQFKSGEEVVENVYSVEYNQSYS